MACLLEVQSQTEKESPMPKLGETAREETVCIGSQGRERTGKIGGSHAGRGGDGWRRSAGQRRCVRYRPVSAT